MYTYAAAASGLGNNVSVDSIAGQLLQRVKLDWGSEGVSVPASGSALYGLLVDVSRIGGVVDVAQDGTWTVQQGGSPWAFTLSGTGSVNVANFPTGFNVNNFPATQAVTQSGTWNVGLNAGSNVIGAVTQSGSWNVGQSGAPWSFNQTQIGGNSIDVGAGSVSSGTQRIIIADDQSAIPVSQSGSWSFTQSGTGTVLVANFPTSFQVSNFPATQAVTQSGGWTVTANQGGAPWSFTQSGTGAVNVTNFPATQAVTQSGSWNVGQSGAPWAMNLTQVGSTPVTVDAGATDAGTQRVILATDQTSIPVTQSGSWTVNTSTASVTGALVTLISTELNSLTTTSITTPASTFNNSAGTYRYADFELLVTYGSNPTAGSQVELYLVPALDATNYADGSGSIVSANNYVGGFVLRATTSAQRIVLREVPLPMCPFRVHVRNSGGQTTAASGNTVRMLPVAGTR